MNKAAKINQLLEAQEISFQLFQIFDLDIKIYYLYFHDPSIGERDNER